jgi:hypothetical protein
VRRPQGICAADPGRKIDPSFNMTAFREKVRRSWVAAAAAGEAFLAKFDAKDEGDV